MPDLDERALDGLAGRGVDDCRAQVERGAPMSVSNVAANLPARDVVRPFGLLGGEDAGDETRRNRSRADAGVRVVGRDGLPRGDAAEAGGKEPSQREERAAAGRARALG
jgi:hypothetical protein